MTAARAIVELGRRVRSQTKTKVRQPLAEAVVHYPGDHGRIQPLLGLVAEELNTKKVVFAESAEQLAGWKAKPNFKTLGPRLGPRVKELAAALAQDGGGVAASLAAGNPAVVELAGGERIDLSPDDVDLAQETKEGWGVASDGRLTVALDLELTRELRLEGLAREVIRFVQDARKAAGLDVSDRIALGLATPSAELAAALGIHADEIARETLAASIDIDGGLVDGAAHNDAATIEGSEIRLGLRPIS
jgi:isoleucyl-tRNA synthetase